MTKPKRVTRPVVWVVEMLLEKYGWQPGIDSALTKVAALKLKADFQADNPDDRFRVAKYRREK